MGFLTAETAVMRALSVEVATPAHKSTSSVKILGHAFLGCGFVIVTRIATTAATKILKFAIQPAVTAPSSSAPSLELASQLVGSVTGTQIVGRVMQATSIRAALRSPASPLSSPATHTNASLPTIGVTESRTATTTAMRMTVHSPVL
jgi:hypothetical protein